MNVDRTDPYAALGLNRNATQGQIRRAYRTLLRQNHPDTRPSAADPADNAAFDTTLRQVIAAYGILSDPACHAGQDHTGPHQTSIPTRIRSGTPFRRNAPEQPPIQVGPVIYWSRR